MARELDSTWEPGNLQDLEYLSLARVLIAKGDPFEALDILERINEVATERGHISLAIEVMNLQALALDAGGEADEAMIVLQQALTIAEPGGFLRIFIDEGPAMARLLYEALAREISMEYVQKLLAAFPDAVSEKDPLDHPFASDSEWIEPLSERELEVLQLIAEGLSRQEIASQLVLSLNTVKTHARNIYSKLGVNNQMQAVGRARGLGLLDKD
jgi:LuxR family maltose regulon positive regulatory protein